MSYRDTCAQYPESSGCGGGTVYCTYTPLSSVTAPPTFSDSSASAATFSELMTFEVKLSINFAV